MDKVKIKMIRDNGFFIPPPYFMAMLLLLTYDDSFNPVTLSLASSTSAIPGSASFQRERESMVVV
jgi:hypothetical protein